MKVLFITSTRIGDAVLSTSLLSYLTGKYPKAQVTIACGSLAAPLFEHFPQLDRLIVLTRGPFFKHWRNLWFNCVGTLWDMVIDLRGSAFSFVVPCKQRYVWRSSHSLDHRVVQMRTLMKGETPSSPQVWLSSKEQEKAQALLQDHPLCIGIGPAANWTGKEWPQERFSELIRTLTTPGGLYPHASIVVFGAPQEKARLYPLIRSFKGLKVLNLAGELSLLEVAACLKHCALYVGNDSGLMHMSAACGTPTVGLFGPSRIEHYAPWGAHCRAVRTDEPYEDLIKYNGQPESLLTSLPVSRVLEAIEDLHHHMNSPVSEKRVLP